LSLISVSVLFNYRKGKRHEKEKIKEN
jgi:hypothetical protein